ncbi:hypothetical protein CLU79DRAFT_890787 [Phycomyces nitens]|nr:hypothetical protein CLU79DRAFT_890787 [Phycomyces nitens]
MKYKYDGPKRTHVRTDADYQQHTVKIESKIISIRVQRTFANYERTKTWIQTMDTDDEYKRNRIRTIEDDMNDREIRAWNTNTTNVYELRTNENMDTDEQHLTTTITHDDEYIDPSDEHQTKKNTRRRR